MDKIMEAASESSTALSTMHRATPTPSDIEMGKGDLCDLDEGTVRAHLGQGHGLSLGTQPGSLVINVSRQVEVENTESPTGRTRRQSDYLRATNKANCWNGNGNGNGNENVVRG